MRHDIVLSVFAPVVAALCATQSFAAAASPRPVRNVVIFVADGLRAGSVNETDAPTLSAVRRDGVEFANSHSLFPTFTTPNASAIATGHYLGDTGDFNNNENLGFRIFSSGNFGQYKDRPMWRIEISLKLLEGREPFCQIVEQILKLEVEQEWRDSADCTSVSLEIKLKKRRTALILHRCNSNYYYYYILDSEIRYTKEE